VRSVRQGPPPPSSSYDWGRLFRGPGLVRGPSVTRMGAVLGAAVNMGSHGKRRTTHLRYGGGDHAPPGCAGVAGADSGGGRRFGVGDRRPPGRLVAAAGSADRLPRRRRPLGWTLGPARLFRGRRPAVRAGTSSCVGSVPGGVGHDRVEPGRLGGVAHPPTMSGSDGAAASTRSQSASSPSCSPAWPRRPCRYRT